MAYHASVLGHSCVEGRILARGSVCVSPASSARAPEEEIRFAVVLNGGVSLAVWMGGAVLELDRVTRRDGPYDHVLSRVAGNARADVIAGTSACGINGAALALAHVNSSDATIDAYFDYIDQYDIMHLCSSEPANFAGIAAVSVADTALTPDTDFTKANGDVSGRKVTVAAKVCRPGRRVRHRKQLVIARVSGGTMRYVTTCTPQAVTPSG